MSTGRGLILLIRHILYVLGYIFMHLRYGNNHKDVLDKKYEGFYAAAGARILRMALTVSFLLFFVLIVVFAIVIQMGN